MLESPLELTLPGLLLLAIVLYLLWKFIERINRRDRRRRFVARHGGRNGVVCSYSIDHATGDVSIITHTRR